MPSVPKIRNRGGNIRIIKVLREMKSQNCSQSDRHIRISGKIKIDLKSVCHNSYPRHQHTHLIIFQGRYLCPQKSEIVGQKNFFRKSRHKAFRSVADGIQVGTPFLKIFFDLMIL